MAPTPDLSSLLERTQQLIPLLRRNAATAEELRRVPDENIKALADAGVFRMTVTGSFATDAHCAGEAVMRGTQTKDLPGLPASGKPFTVRYAIYADLRDGRITRVVDYWNAAEFTAS